MRVRELMGRPIGGHKLIQEEGYKMGQVIVLEKQLDEISIESPKQKNEKLFNPEGGSKMNTTRNKRARLSFARPSPYPLPKGLLTGFWGE